MATPVARIADSHPVLVYTAARLGLLILVGLPLYLAGARGLLLLVAAFLISGLLSLILLDGTRSRFSGTVSGFFQRINDRIDAAARAEDHDEEPAEQAAPSADKAEPEPEAETRQ